MNRFYKASCVAASFLLIAAAFAADEVQESVVVEFGKPAADLDAVHLSTLPLPTRMIEVPQGTTRAPAPGLTYLQVAFVGSTNFGGFESLSSGQLSTSFDHGGPQLRIVTDEIGYGSNPVAKFNGAVLPSSSNYLTENICQSGSSYVVGCSVGQTIAGFRKYWNVDGNQSGSFTYQNTSTNFPFNTLSDGMTVR